MATIALTPAQASTYTVDDQRRMAQAKSYFAWQGRLVVAEIGQRVLEVGCGTGNFTTLLLDRELVLSLDKEVACIERLKQRYRNQPNLQAFVCDVASYEFRKFANFAPDSCVCLNLLEHIEDDLGLLQSVKAILRPGGVMVLILPAFPSLYGPIDQNLAHFRRYTMSSFQQLAAKASLRVKKAQYMNAIGFFAWWANARIFRRQAQSEAQIAFFDRYVVPLASRAEAIAPPPFGQSIFAVLQKP